MKRQTNRVNFTLEEEFIQKLQQEAEIEKRTLSSMIRVILKGYFRQQEQDSTLTQIFKSKEGTCGRCAYFRSHYIRRGEYFFPVSCGHCARPRVKARKPTVAACENFIENKENPQE